MIEDGERGQPGYIELLPARRHDAQQPAVVALPVSQPYGIYQVSRMQIEESLPRDIVAFIEWLLRSSGWTVEDAWTGERRALVPDDVCILFRRYLSWNRDVTRPYTRALEARGIPHVLVGARTFHQREEVETLRSALTAVEWPDDPLAVFATLRGSLFSIDDEMLLRFHRGRKFRLHPFATGRERRDRRGARVLRADVVGARPASRTFTAGATGARWSRRSRSCSRRRGRGRRSRCARPATRSCSTRSASATSRARTSWAAASRSAASSND